MFGLGKKRIVKQLVEQFSGNSRTNGILETVVNFRYAMMTVEVEVTWSYVGLIATNFVARYPVLFSINRPVWSAGAFVLVEGIRGMDKPCFSNGICDPQYIQQFWNDPSNREDIAALELHKGGAFLMAENALEVYRKAHDFSRCVRDLEILHRLWNRNGR